jgi:hypothetical protein
MLFMNTWEINQAADRHASHPVLGPATRTLANLRDAADANSDGWCYWPKPGRAAKKLMELVQAGGDPTPSDLNAAYRPVKTFRTQSKINFEIVEPSA